MDEERGKTREEREYFKEHEESEFSGRIPKIKKIKERLEEQIKKHISNMKPKRKEKRARRRRGRKRKKTIR